MSSDVVIAMHRLTSLARSAKWTNAAWYPVGSVGREEV
jgi:hypothetical protein